MYNLVLKTLFFTILSLMVSVQVEGQRSPYAGGRPTGYKDRFRPKPNATEEDIINRFGNGEDAVIDPNAPTTTQKPPQGVQVVQAMPGYFVPNEQGVLVAAPVPTTTVSGIGSGLGNRFSPDDITGQSQSTTTNRIPYDAYGDQELVNILNNRPLDQRPFWLINAQAIEAHRNATPGVLNTPAGNAAATIPVNNNAASASTVNTAQFGGQQTFAARSSFLG